MRPDDIRSISEALGDAIAKSPNGKRRRRRARVVAGVSAAALSCLFATLLLLYPPGVAGSTARDTGASANISSLSSYADIARDGPYSGYGSSLGSVGSREPLRIKFGYNTSVPAQDAVTIYTSVSGGSYGGEIAKGAYFEDGYLVAEPSGIDLSGGMAVRSEDSWGSFSRLYAVLPYDPNTGEKLGKDVVLPFDIEHDLPSPALSQDVTSDNLYKLSWSDSDGASSYLVYAVSGGSYSLAYETKSSSVDSLALDGKAVDFDGYDTVNESIYNGSGGNPSYVVIASGSGGSFSGMSNMVDSSDIAALLPYSLSSSDIEARISDPSDVPSTVSVIMADGSSSDMLIDYHGSRVGRVQGEPDSTVITPSVYNTPLKPFTLTVIGVPYESVMVAAPGFVGRQDGKSLSKGGTGLSPATMRSEDAPPIDTSGIPPSVIPDDVDKNLFVSMPEGGTTYDLFLSVLGDAESKLGEISGLDSVLYSSSKLGAWIAYALIAQEPYIPVPRCVFPEASDEAYLRGVLMEAYRQNPSAGVIASTGYVSEYESIVVEYCEAPDVRLAKAAQEIAMSRHAADLIRAENAGATDAELAYAANDYICSIGDYDSASADTDVDLTSGLSPEFIDAHTPYGLLARGSGVCEAYAEAFALVARQLGLDTVLDTGYLYGGFHEWAKVRIGGLWYVVDVTNNDNRYAPNSALLVSDSSVASVLTSDKASLIEDKPATDDSLDYYRSVGAYASSPEEAAVMLSSQISASGSGRAKLSFSTNEGGASSIAKDALLRASQSAYLPDMIVRYEGGVICVAPATEG